MMALRQIYRLLSRAQIIDRAPWHFTDTIWRETGLQIRQLYENLITQEFKRNGYEQLLMPSFIPKRVLSRQAQHYRDVSQLSFSVDDDRDFYLRATSECQFADMAASGLFLHWPIRTFQVCSVFRKESVDKVMPLLRSIEIDPFIESITFSSSAKNEVNSELTIYQNIFKKLCLPVYATRRPPWDTFPEARGTIAFDAVIRGNGVSQVASVHDLGTAFAKPFKLARPNGSKMQQTSSGISGRALFVALATHVRQGRVVLPSALCPHLLEISSAFYAKGKAILSCIDASRITISNDRREARRSAVSIPLSLERTPANQIVLSSIIGTRKICDVDQLENAVAILLEEYDQQLMLRAQELFRAALKTKTLEEYDWCGSIPCLLPVAAKDFNMRVLGFGNSPEGDRRECWTCGGKSTLICRTGVVL